MKGFEQGNEWMKLWAENQKSMFEAWVEGKPPPFAFRGEAPPSDAMGQAAQVSELMRQSMEQWAEYAKGAWSKGAGMDPEAMKKLFDPSEWKRAGSHFELGMEKLTEGPTYATLWDLDRKTLGLGLKFSYNKKYTLEMNYVDYANADFDPLQDRDFYSASVSVTF